MSLAPSRLIDRRIRELRDWRGETLREVRDIIRSTDSKIVEEWKWRNPVWSRNGILCTGEAYKSAVKLTFPRGASLKDPSRLFNSSLEGKVRRAIDIKEGDTINAAALKKLVREAVALNTQGPALLSGDNPQIPKGEGDAPVQAYIAAIPGWKRDLARRLDRLITRAVPGVRKAVKWNSPFYGAEGKGWFLDFHCFTNYIKVGFFRGSSLSPLPPGASKHKDVRYLDVRQDDPLDEARFVDWVKQAAALPGWNG